MSGATEELKLSTKTSQQSFAKSRSLYALVEGISGQQMWQVMRATERAQTTLSRSLDVKETEGGR